MSPKEIRLLPLVALAGVCALGAAAVSLALVRGGSLVPQPPWLHAVLLVVIAALVLWFARPVRRHLAGSATSVGTVEALKAARAVVLAQASALLGAIGVGAYAGALFVAVSDWGSSPTTAARCASPSTPCSRPVSSWLPSSRSPGAGSRRHRRLTRPSAYLSTSPTTKNIDPKMATMSASRHPGRISLSTWTLENDAERR